jgi:hypothetical protein
MPLAVKSKKQQKLKGQKLIGGGSTSKEAGKEMVQRKVLSKVNRQY